MKRFAFMVLLMFCVLAMGKGVEKGQLFLSSQVGVASSYGPSMLFKLDHAISRSFSLGVSFEQIYVGEKVFPGLYSWNDPATGYTYNLPDHFPASTSRSFSLEGAYHLSFIRVKRLDIFGGLGIGIDFVNSQSILSNQGPDLRQHAGSTNSQYFSQRFFTGFNYFLTENAGLASRFTMRRNPWDGWRNSATMGFFLRLK